MIQIILYVYYSTMYLLESILLFQVCNEEPQVQKRTNQKKFRSGQTNLLRNNDTKSTRFR